MQGDGIQIGLAVHAQVGAFGQGAAQQAVGVLVDAALPRAVRYLFTPPAQQPAGRPTARPTSSAGVTKVDMFGHEAGRPPLAAPALHRVGDEVVGHA
jgi:hypothetical protein